MTKNPHTRLTDWRVDDSKNSPSTGLEIKRCLGSLGSFVSLVFCFKGKDRVIGVDLRDLRELRFAHCFFVFDCL